MTRFSDEWLDAKLMNIQRWKAQEAARSAAKQSTSGGVESRHAAKSAVGDGVHPRTAYDNDGTGKEGTSGNVPGAGTSCRLSGEGVMEPTYNRRQAKNALGPDSGQAGVAPGPLTSTAGAASPAGVPSTPVAAPAPDDVQWICAPCGARHCNGMRDEHIATWHIGRCDICADETAVTEPRDFGYLKATKADAQLTDAPGATRSHDGAAARRQPDGGVIAASSGTKYRNKPTNGYASKREAKRAAALRLMQEAGQIQGLREQVEFLLIPRQTRPDGTAERSCSYWADFVYDEWTADGWRRVVEDVKGMRTPDYVIKRKLMLFVHGVAVREV